MDNKMRTLFAWLVACCLASGSVAAFAADSQVERATLTGLTPISVVVEELPAIAERSGLTTAALQADVERRLRQAGISLTTDADAYLYVHVTVADPGGAQALPYIVDVSLMQEVTLPRGLKTRTPLQVPTWSVNNLGLVGATGLRVAVSDHVSQFVDQFIKAYQSVNSKAP
jgi:hypothetical protein